MDKSYKRYYIKRILNNNINNDGDIINIVMLIDSNKLMFDYTIEELKNIIVDTIIDTAEYSISNIGFIIRNLTEQAAKKIFKLYPGKIDNRYTHGLIYIDTVYLFN